MIQMDNIQTIQFKDGHKEVTIVCNNGRLVSAKGKCKAGDFR
ncbi:unnamed protein product [marine sediment metagenome]|uniref:Uncharacterized protein n=1 Tax=marine sediment metagenome TaxID=412755 RepID=X0XU73_9ZZZZ